MLNERLKELRKTAKLSQRSLAETLNVSQQTVGKWETGGATPNPETLAAIADIFHISVDYLIGRTENQMDDDRLKYALFGGNVDDEILEEVKRFAKYAQERNRKFPTDDSTTL